VRRPKPARTPSRPQATQDERTVSRHKASGRVFRDTRFRIPCSGTGRKAGDKSRPDCRSVAERGALAPTTAPRPASRINGSQRAGLQVEAGSHRDRWWAPCVHGVDDLDRGDPLQLSRRCPRSVCPSWRCMMFTATPSRASSTAWACGCGSGFCRTCESKVRQGLSGTDTFQEPDARSVAEARPEPMSGLM
jgi:hypothetical protein